MSVASAKELEPGRGTSWTFHTQNITKEQEMTGEKQEKSRKKDGAQAAGRL